MVGRTKFFMRSKGYDSYQGERIGLGKGEDDLY